MIQYSVFTLANLIWEFKYWNRLDGVDKSFWLSQKQTDFAGDICLCGKNDNQSLRESRKSLLQYIPNSTKSRSVHRTWRPKSTRLPHFAGWVAPSITARKANNTVVGVYLIFSPSFRSLSSKRKKMSILIENFAEQGKWQSVTLVKGWHVSSQLSKRSGRLRVQWPQTHHWLVSRAEKRSRVLLSPNIHISLRRGRLCPVSQEY